jgi:hypothetical protein
MQFGMYIFWISPKATQMLSFANNRTAAQAVDREFVDIVYPLGLFWLPVDWLWIAFGLNLGPTWFPLGCPWTPWRLHGTLVAPSGLPRGSLGDPLGISWGFLGLLWGALGCPGRFHGFFKKWIPNSEQMCLFARACT